MMWPGGQWTNWRFSSPKGDLPQLVQLAGLLFIYVGVIEIPPWNWIQNFFSVWHLNAFETEFFKWCLFAQQFISPWKTSSPIILLMVSLMFFGDIRILWTTLTSLGEELWRWIDWNLVPSPAILTGLPMGRAGQMASKQKEQWCHDRLGSHVAVFCCGTRSLDLLRKLRFWGPGMVQLWSRSVQVWSSWVYPTMTGLKSPFASPESQAGEHPATAWEVIPSNDFQRSKKTRKNHEKPWRVIPWTSHLFPWKNHMALTWVIKCLHWTSPNH